MVGITGGIIGVGGHMPDVRNPWQQKKQAEGEEGE